jgi:hypothetical protein
MVARLDEALLAEADSLGIKGDMATTIEKLSTTCTVATINAVTALPESPMRSWKRESRMSRNTLRRTN